MLWFQTILQSYSNKCSMILAIKHTDQWNRIESSEMNPYRVYGQFCCCCCSVAKLCLTLCNPMDYSMPGYSPPLSPRVCSNSCPLSQRCYLTISSSAALFSFCLQYLLASGLFQWVSSSHQLAKVLELQQQSFWWIFRVISFRIDWFYLLAVQATLKSLLQ